MEIPESISNLTQETVADRFLVNRAQQQVSFDSLIELCRQQLPYQDCKSLEEGLTFYKKDTVSDLGFTKNLCHLYNDALTKAIQTSNIIDDNKADVTKALTVAINGIIQNIDSIYGIITFLNAGKNIIDVQKISCIILGYVIDTIKRKNYTKH